LQILYIAFNFNRSLLRKHCNDFRFKFPMTTFKTENRHGYSVKFSPNRSNLLAIATSQYYGFKGGGTLFLVSYDEDRCLITKKYEMHWEDGLFDVVWSRSVYSLLVTGSGDGTVQMWNYKYPSQVINNFYNIILSTSCTIDDSIILSITLMSYLLFGRNL